MDDSMDGFNQRRKAFEAKYLHDEELTYRIHAKRNHLFGLWVAGLLGYRDDGAEKYAQEVILVEIQKTHEDDVIHKVLRDLKARKVKISEHRVRKKLEDCREAAYSIIMNDEGL